jgi:O-antigen ligase
MSAEQLDLVGNSRGDATSMNAGARSRASATTDLPLRPLIFVGAFLFAWISLKPFPDLGSDTALDLVSGQDTVTVLVFAALALLGVGVAASTDRPAFRSLLTPAFSLLAVWIAIATLTSQDVAFSIKHAAIFAILAALAAALPLMPSGRAQMATLLSLAAAALLALSYFGILFLPEYAIHQASDFLEPELAGDWRGVFGHKNVASFIFCFVAFIGIYDARLGHRLRGSAIVAASLAFVFFAHSKSALALWIPTLAVSLLASRAGDRMWWRLLALAPVLALNAIGLGSAFFEPLAMLAASLPVDSTFTGRIDVWRFAVGQIPAHMLTGEGFSAFWNTQSVRYGADDSAAWVANAANGHNGFLDAALTMGLPGLALTLWAFAIQPLRDVGRAARSSADPATLTLMTQIWLFGLYVSSFESFMFARTDPTWFTFLFAVFGLRYLASFPTKA